VWLGLRLRPRLLLLLLGPGLVEGLLLLEEVAVAVGAVHAREVIEVNHLLELAVAGVAVVSAESAANVHVGRLHLIF